MIKHIFYFIFFTGYAWANTNPPNLITPSSSKHFTFEENKGQLNNKVLFTADLPGGRLFFEKNAFTYVFYDVNQWNEQLECSHQPGCMVKPVNAHAYQMKFLNANAHVNILYGNSSTTYKNYFIGNDPTKWASRVKLYDEFTYQNIYDHIDLRLYKVGGNLKYDFVIQPGGNPNDIVMEYEGVENLYTVNNDIKITTSVNELTENMPSVYQVKNGQAKEINSSYLVEGGKVKFNVTGNYDFAYPLTIDPEVVISTYCGTTGGMEGVGATYGENGTMYVSGARASFGYPTTVGAYQVMINDEWDISIGKYDSTGSTLLYATYIGGIMPGLGNDIEYPSVMRMAKDSSLYVMGHVNTTNFPMTENGFDTSFNGLVDIVMFRLSKDGDSLMASTYIGGSDYDGPDTSNGGNYGIYANRFSELIEAPGGGFYVSYATASSDFPTNNALQGYGGMTDGCLFYIGADLDTLYWSTFLGGSSNDAAFHVNIGPDSLLYVTGMTNSADFAYISPYAYRTALAGGSGDAFVIKVTQDGSQVKHGTLLGTSSFDVAYFTDFDSDSTLYVLGFCSGNDYPVSDCRYFNEGAIFLEKLSDSLDASFFSTRLGERDAVPLAFMVDSCARIYTASWNGIGSTAMLPVTEDAYDTMRSFGAGSQFYVTVLSKNARALDYATYLGGGHDGGFWPLTEHSDGGISRFNKNDNTLYLAGCTYSPDFPTDPTDVFPVKIAPAGGIEVVGVKMIMNNLVNRWEPIFDYSGPTKGCKPLNADFLASIPCGYESTWHFGLNNDSLVGNTPSYLYDTAGIFNIMIVSVDKLIGDLCKLPPDTGYLSIEVVDELVIFIDGDSTICFNDTLELSASGANSYLWTPATGLETNNSDTTKAFPSSTTTYTIIGSVSGCSDTVQHTVTVFPLPEGACCDDTIILGSSTSLVASSGNTYLWMPATGLSCTDCVNPTASPDSTTTYYVTITTPDGCQKVDTIIVYVLEELLSVPSIFSPNGDGTNDYFEIFHEGIKDVLEYKIFNRWGEIVFQSDDLNVQWNGIYNDQIQEIGVYYYKISALSEAGTEYLIDGTLTLIR